MIALQTRRLSPLASALLVAVLGGTLCIFFEPVWESDDDVAMAMVAKGFGLAAHASPNILFSNVIWGAIVGRVPDMFGISGYVVATYAILFVSAWACLVLLQRLNAAPWLSLMVVTLVFSRPVLFPQFTLNAGFLAVASVLGVCVYLRDRSISVLVIAAMLAFGGFLVRWEELGVVFAVALPLLASRRAVRSRAAVSVLAVWLLAAGTAVGINHSAYQSSGWQTFQAMNLARAPVTDFGAGERLVMRPDLLQENGYSENDIRLLEKWFFGDPDLLDPRRLNSLVAKIGVFAPVVDASQSISAAGEGLIVPALLPLLVAGALLFFVRPGRRLSASWALFGIIVVVIALAGRPGISRVTYPMLALLCLAPLLHPTSTFRGRVFGALLVGAHLLNGYFLIPAARQATILAALAAEDVASLSGQTLYTWGPAYPYTLVYAPLRPWRTDIRLNSFGVLTYAPFSVAMSERASGRVMLEQLQSDSGIQMITGEAQLELLGKYCQEHIRRQIDAEVLDKRTFFSVWRVRCVQIE